MKNIASAKIDFTFVVWVNTKNFATETEIVAKAVSCEIMWDDKYDSCGFECFDTDVTHTVCLLMRFAR